MKSFIELYNEIKRPIDRETLSRDVTLTDTELLKFAYLLAHKKDKNPENLCIIDPSVMESLRRYDQRGLPLSEYTKKQFNEDIPLILLPICDKSHWSLLYYRASSDHWVHMDSLQPLHSTTAIHVLSVLKDLGLTRVTKIVTFIGLPQQSGYWECGTFTLLYMMTVMSFSDQEIKNSVWLLSDRCREKMCEILRGIL
jgi:hypothetical protein